MWPSGEEVRSHTKVSVGGSVGVEQRCYEGSKQDVRLPRPLEQQLQVELEAQALHPARAERLQGIQPEERLPVVVRPQRRSGPSAATAYAHVRI